MTPELSIIWPALIAGLLVTATHAPLGVQVLKRGIVFIDLAVAQIAGLGVVLADSLDRFRPIFANVRSDEAVFGAALLQPVKEPAAVTAGEILHCKHELLGCD